MIYRGEEMTDNFHGMHVQGQFGRLQWCAFYWRKKRMVVVEHDDGVVGMDGYTLKVTLFGIRFHF